MYEHTQSMLTYTSFGFFFGYICNTMKKKITIKDIARVANVSIGTVDRVIHKRGKVSETALQQVNDALKELDYKPNPLARTLRNNVVYKINILIPDPNKDPYWVPCEQGINAVIEEYEAFDIEISVLLFDPSKPESFSQIGNDLVEKGSDALLFVPLFEKESVLLLEKLNKKDILTGTFNSLPRNHVDHHVGHDLFLSGRVAAKLVSDVIQPSSRIGIIHINEAVNNAIHMRQKEKGFRTYFKDHYADHDVLTKKINTSNVTEALRDFIAEEKVDIFFVTTSKTYEVALALKQLNKKATVVGYDLLPENVACLQNGEIQFLIHQAPKLQASLSLKNLVEKLLFNKEFPKKQLLPIEIINSENIKSYL